MERGDLVLSYEHSFFSWVVRTVTRSKWSHVSIAIDDKSIVSAVPLSGVSESPLPTERCAIYRLTGVPQEKRLKMVSFCVERMGAPYDYIQALLLAWRIFTDTIKTADGDPCKDRYLCSELISEAAASEGIHFGHIVDNVLPETIAASELTTKVE